ncbi:MAG: TlpA family protein disulfide reductase [Chloroflexi bacterium]|nr:MAG: TlpA family protein disulfide reductase [Chloroflexota bacterium]
MGSIFIVSTILLWILVLLNLLLTFGIVRRVNLRSSNVPQWDDELLEAGATAPDFTVDTLSGESVSLAEYEGFRRILIFLSVGCTPCVEALPKIKDIALRIESSDGVLALIFSQSVEDVMSFADDHHLKLPIWTVPPSSSFWQDYNVTGTPSFCVIDPQNKVVSSGFLGGVEWENILDIDR